jgi:predicted dehydrogenase
VDWREALADAAVEAVTVCLPHHLHAEVGIAALGAGKHVLVEKPLAATLAEADAMITAATGAGMTLMVAENVLWSPLHRRVAELVKAGAIGQPALVQVSRGCYLRRSFLAERPWFLDARQAAGGIMMSGGVHDFAKLGMFMDEVASVRAVRARQRFAEMQGDDTSVALLRFRGNAVGTLVESFLWKSARTATEVETHSLRIDGDLGSIVAEGQHEGTLRLYSEAGSGGAGPRDVEEEILVPPADTFRLEVGHFIDCVASGEEPIASGRRMRRPLELVLAAYRSMETGTEVAV